jgi:hypothetical protein
MPRCTSRSQRTLALALLTGAAVVLAGCVSYTIGQGAGTVAPGERTLTSTMNVVPGTLKANGTTETPTRRPSMDSEVRYGLSDRSDLGLRVATMSGAIVTYKRQLLNPAAAPRIGDRWRVATSVGAGVINLAEHGAAEATLIVSSPWGRTGQSYGGVRAIHTVPLNATARRDDPVAGVALGHLFGDTDEHVGVELGVYYDRSVLGLNSNRVLLIPSIVWRNAARRHRR